MSCAHDQLSPRPSQTIPAREALAPVSAAARVKLWRPRRVLITPDALALPGGRRMLDRAASYGADVIRLASNRLPPFMADSDQKRYALAKTTFAIVVSPPGQRKLQPIPPSADWQFHLAQGCPAHCQYCYLRGLAQRAPCNTGLRQSRRHTRGPKNVRRYRSGHLQIAKAVAGGHHVRSLLLHRSPRH